MVSSRMRRTTQHLTHAPAVLSIQRSARRRPVALLSLLALTLLVGALAFSDAWRQWPWWPQWVRDVIPHPAVVEKSARQWQQELDALQRAMEAMRLEQQIEHATRQKLERQIVKLQEQLKAATLERDFVKSNHPPSRPPANR